MEIIQNTNHLEERSWLRRKSNRETLQQLSSTRSVWMVSHETFPIIHPRLNGIEPHHAKTCSV